MSYVKIKTFSDHDHVHVGRLVRSAPSYFTHVQDNATDYLVHTSLGAEGVERFLRSAINALEFTVEELS